MNLRKMKMVKPIKPIILPTRDMKSVWKTKDGRSMKVWTMTNTHIHNCIKMLKGAIAKYRQRHLLTEINNDIVGGFQKMIDTFENELAYREAAKKLKVHPYVDKKEI